MRYTYFYITLIIVVSLSCTKAPIVTTVEIKDTNNAILILNSGGFNNNNSSITHYDLITSTTSQGYYQHKNGRKLGDTGNDLVVYGSNIYVIVNNSHIIEILDKNTGVSKKKISLLNEKGVGRSPRKMVFKNGKGYLSSFDGSIGLFDTTSLNFERFIHSGRNPDGISISKDKLIVTNSGGLDAPNYDSTITVFHIPELIKDTMFFLNLNPTGVYTAPNDDIYITTNGNYTTIKPYLHIIDPTTFEIKKSIQQSTNDIEFIENTAYISSYNYNSNSSMISKFNINTLTYSESKTFSNIVTLYGIDSDPIEKKIYCLDANSYTKSGKIFCYDLNWNLDYEFTTGIIPIKLVLLNQK